MFPPHKTRIVCTLGPASWGKEGALIEAGMDVARLNLAHGDFPSHRKALEAVRRAAQAAGRRAAVLADLPGPKLRLGKLPPEGITLAPGMEVTLGGEGIPVAFPHLAEKVRPGQAIFLNDGTTQLQVEAVIGEKIICRVIAGGQLRSGAGMNLPGVALGTEAITQRDRECLAFALEEGVDAVSVSFVEEAAQVEAVRRLAGPKAPFLIAKIERAQAVEHLDAILEAADGLMVARGDLGVEIPLERIAAVQKAIIEQANRAGKPVITATQMLASMVTQSRPTRAEVTDVANAILDGTDGVMLSEESAIGAHPVESTAWLARIARASEGARRSVPVREAFLRHPPSRAIEEVIAFDVLTTVERLEADLVIALTHSGATARRIARFRLPQWILAVSPLEATCQQLVFSYGVYPLKGEGTRQAMDWLRKKGLAQGLAVMTQAASRGHPGGTNGLEIVNLEQREE